MPESIPSHGSGLCEGIGLRGARRERAGRGRAVIRRAPKVSVEKRTLSRNSYTWRMGEEYSRVDACRGRAEQGGAELGVDEQ
jgi:hypothetical protein